MPKHFIVVLKNFLGEALKNPRMLQSLERGHPIQRMPLEAPVQEVKEDSVGALQDFAQLLCAGLSYLASRVGSQNWLIVFAEEKMLPLGKLEDIIRGEPIQLHDVCKLLNLALSRKKWETGVQLGHYSAEAPHVNRGCVWYTKDDLWRSVKP
jgi:hypothetical protein